MTSNLSPRLIRVLTSTCFYFDSRRGPISLLPQLLLRLTSRTNSAAPATIFIAYTAGNVSSPQTGESLIFYFDSRRGPISLLPQLPLRFASRTNVAAPAASTSTCRGPIPLLPQLLLRLASRTNSRCFRCLNFSPSGISGCCSHSPLFDFGRPFYKAVAAVFLFLMLAFSRSLWGLRRGPDGSRPQLGFAPEGDSPHHAAETRALAQISGC